jgi:hypothetical protein
MEIAKEIFTIHNGSSHKARQVAIANDEVPPSQNVYNKIKNEFKHREVPTSDWIRNLLFIGRSYHNCDFDYVKSCDVFPEINMHLYLDQSIKILHDIPEQHRISFMDSTGGLCHITKTRASWYQKIQNYFFLTKDLRNHNTEKFMSLLINEMISSSHNTSSISSMLRKVKDSYEIKYGKKLVYRLVNTNYSWATIHAIIETLNSENAITYANKVFHLGKLKKLSEVDEFLKNRSWLVSCASHTMKRFVNNLKSNINI